MPSLNASSPTLPGLGAGLFPMASNQAPSVTGDGPGDFAAMVVLPDAPPGPGPAPMPVPPAPPVEPVDPITGLAPIEGPAAPDIVTYVDTVPTMPPGTGLPDERQDIAAPVPDVPAVEAAPAEPTIVTDQESQ